MEDYKTIVKYSAKDGRVTIPRELRRELKLYKIDRLQLTVRDNQIILEPENKKEELCDLCGKSENVITLENYNICEECIIKLLNGGSNAANE